MGDMSELIRRERRRAGLGVTATAQRAGWSRYTQHRLETARVEPSVAHVRVLAEVLRSPALRALVARYDRALEREERRGRTS